MQRSALKCLFLLAASYIDAYARPFRKDWSNVDINKLEEQWDEGDNLSQDELSFHEAESRRKVAMDKLQLITKPENGGKVPNDKEFEKLAKEVQDAGKPAMIFAKLQMDKAPRISNGQNAWNWGIMAEICDEWHYRVGFKMVEITCYPSEPDSILVTVQKGWYGQDVYDYLSEQDIIEELSWNGNKIYPSQRLPAAPSDELHKKSKKDKHEF